jgi:hypothetical protein
MKSKETVTRRDQYIMAALSGLLAAGHTGEYPESGLGYEQSAEWSVEYADAAIRKADEKVQAKKRI